MGKHSRRPAAHVRENKGVIEYHHTTLTSHPASCPTLHNTFSPATFHRAAMVEVLQVAAGVGMLGARRMAMPSHQRPRKKTRESRLCPRIRILGKSFALSNVLRQMQIAQAHAKGGHILNMAPTPHIM